MKNFTILVLAVVILGLCSTAMALDPMGAPKANLEKAQYSIGADYSLSEMTIGRIPASWTSSTKKTAEVDEMHKVYATLGYGLSENVEGFVRIGMGSPEVDREGGSTHWESDGGDWDAIWGGGVKVTLCENETVAWGILAQYSSGDLACDQKEIGGTGEQKIELEISEFQLAIGPTVEVAEGVSVYGGPFLHIIDGSYIDKQSDGDVLTKSIEEESTFGGYIGALIKISENTNLSIEYQDTGDASALAGGITIRF